MGINGPLRVSGRVFMNDAGMYRPVWVSSFGTLSQLIHGDEHGARVYLEWAARTGFGGVRLFCGNLVYLGPQTFDQAVNVLGRALDIAGEYGLHVEASAITDSAEDPRYDPGEHARIIGDICESRANAIVEVANEPYHSTQASAVHDVNNLRLWGSTVGTRPWACGSAEIDEVDANGNYPTAGGSYNTAHLNRDREWPVQMARLRELEKVSETYNNPCVNNEPIGWDERTNPGKRLAVPEAFWQMGCECRLLELPCIGHGEHALRSLLPGPVQQQCAEALLQGWHAADTLVDKVSRAHFENGHWSGSPFTGHFAEPGGSFGDTNTVWRIHSGLTGNRGGTVCSGVYGDPGYRDQGGWRRVRLVEKWSQTELWEVAR